MIRKILVTKPGERVRPVAAAFHILLLCTAVTGVFWLSMAMLHITFDFSFLGHFYERIGEGFFYTVAISGASLVLSLLLGIVSAAGQSVSILFIRYACNLYVTFMRGTPLIMQIYLFFYIIGTAWGIENRFIAGVLILSLFEGAYIAEIIRGSLLTLEESQLEAARAVGFTRRQIVTCVILPQMTAAALPALTGQFASIIKDSSLLSMIAVIELTQTMREISTVNFKLFECYLLLGFLYLALTLPISVISRRLEKRFAYAH